MCKIFTHNNVFQLGTFIFFHLLLKAFKFEILNVRHCADSKPVIKMINQSYGLNENCEVTSTSCSHVEPYKSAMVCILYLKSY